MKKIEVFEMRCFKKILNSSWTDRVTNKDVFEQISLQKCHPFKDVKKVKLNYLRLLKRHVPREDLQMAGIKKEKAFGEDPESYGLMIRDNFLEPSVIELLELLHLEGDIL